MVNGIRCRLPRRGRLPVPDRPQGVHDHLWRGEHLPAGSRERPRAAPEGLRRGGDRRARRRNGRTGQGRRPVARRCSSLRRAGRRDHHIRPQPHRSLQGTPVSGLRRRIAKAGNRKAGQTSPDEPLRGGTHMTVEAPHPARAFDPVSISPLSFWELTAEERERSFKILRDERRVSWHPPIEGALMPAPIDGLWAVTRNEDIAFVSKNPELFCSGQGVMIEAVPEDILDAAQSFLAMDDPKHSALRRLISSVFTPRQVAKIQDQVNSQAVRIVDDLLKTTEGDFVNQVSKRLPMRTIYDMVGLPEEEQEEAAHYADGMVSWNDSDVAAGREPGEVLNDSLVGLLTIGLELAGPGRSHRA